MGRGLEYKGSIGWGEYYMAQVVMGPSARCHAVNRLLLAAHQRALLPPGEKREMAKEELAVAAGHFESNNGEINFQQLAKDAGRPEARMRAVVALAQEFNLPPFRNF